MPTLRFEIKDIRCCLPTMSLLARTSIEDTSTNFVVVTLARRIPQAGKTNSWLHEREELISEQDDCVIPDECKPLNRLVPLN